LDPDVVKSASCCSARVFAFDLPAGRLITDTFAQQLPYRVTSELLLAYRVTIRPSGRLHFPDRRGGRADGVSTSRAPHGAALRRTRARPTRTPRDSPAYLRAGVAAVPPPPPPEAAAAPPAGAMRAGVWRTPPCFFLKHLAGASHGQHGTANEVPSPWPAWHCKLKNDLSRPASRGMAIARLAWSRDRGPGQWPSHTQNQFKSSPVLGVGMSTSPLHNTRVDG
jgi:hypothetical protein